MLPLLGAGAGTPQATEYLSPPAHPASESLRASPVRGQRAQEAVQGTTGPVSPKASSSEADIHDAGLGPAHSMPEVSLVGAQLPHLAGGGAVSVLECACEVKPTTNPGEAAEPSVLSEIQGAAEFSALEAPAAAIDVKPAVTHMPDP